MTTEDLNPACGEFQAELVRLACGESDGPTAELRAHLATCPACRDELEASREVVGVLRDALEPESLPTELLERFRQDVNAARRRRAGLWRWSVSAGVVAAAAAIGLVVIPRATRPNSDSEAWAPSAQDAAAIAHAYGQLAWDSPDDSLAYIETQVQSVAETLEGGTNNAGGLPWGAGDDWDMPAADAGSSSAPGRPERPLADNWRPDWQQA